jgi:RimJ/RimL family protein N-acetyltransferase
MITEENFLDFKCPHCGELNSFPQDCAGFARECLNCMESLIVPEAGGTVGRRLPLPLTTPRLVLRRLDAGDSRDLLEFMFEEEEDALRWLEQDRQIKLTTPDQTFSLGVEARDGGGQGKIVGCLGLKFTDRGCVEAEISVGGNQKAPDQGIALEAVDAALGFCFRDLKLHRVFAVRQPRRRGGPVV